MPRVPRADEAGGLYHALKRGNLRADIVSQRRRLCSGHIDRRIERCGNESCECGPIDSRLRTFSDLVREVQNTVDSTIPAADIPPPLLTQDKPSVLDQELATQDTPS